MTRLLLVRHGASAWHREDRYTGASDIDLSPAGQAQAERLGLWAAGAGLDAIWSSPMVRARATLAPAASTTGLPVSVDERLRELDFGLAEGLTKAELQEQHPQAWQRFAADPVIGHFPGGEDPQAAAARVVATLHDIAAAADGATVLVVGHSTAWRLALCALAGVPLARYRTLLPKLVNCAVSEIRLDSNGQFSLLSLNTAPTPVG